MSLEGVGYAIGASGIPSWPLYALIAMKEISPRPLPIIHRKKDFLAPAHHAHNIYEQAEEPKKLATDEGWVHYDMDPFFSSAERANGAI